VKLFPLDAFPTDRPAAIDDEGHVLSYGELAQIFVRLAVKVPTRTVALVLTRNTLGCIAAIVALIKQGVVPILLDASASDATVKLYLVRYQPEVMVVPTAMQEQYPLHACLLSIFDYTVLATGVEQNRPLVHPDLTLLLSTSGSTGNPKLVRQSRLNVLSNAEAIVGYLRIGPADRPVTSLPLHYTYGFSILSSHLHAGATLLVTERSVMEKSFWEFFSEAGGTSFAGVPYTYQMLKRLGFMRKNPGSLRTLTQAGGKLADNLVREFVEYAGQTGIDFFVMYGQAEATARISYVPPALALEKAGSIGVAIPGGEMFLVDPAGREITSVGVEGQLGYRGANVSMGYAENRTDLARGDERDGTLLTGDLARRDVDGYYYITGRLSRIVKLFGKRLNLEDLEQICLDLVPEVACLGTEDRVTICITQAQHKAALPRLLAERTAIHASAYQVRVVDSLPRTPAGKTDYQALLGEVPA
jgi:acyl-coenzyme A synthetase/AMP-(fatty) acid ligase